MTTMVRSPTIRFSSSPVSSRSSAAHARDRLVEEHHLGVLHQQHADLEPLLLPVGEDPGRAVRQRGQADGLQRLLDDLGHLPAGEQQPHRLAVQPGGDVEVLQDAELLEHRRGLEGPADAQAHDLVRLHRRAGSGCGTRAWPVPCTSPVRASTRVVLPAPFGPMRKCSRPWRKVTSTPSIALKPSKSTVRSRISR